MEQIEWYLDSNIGNLRQDNEDNFYCNGFYRRDMKVDNIIHSGIADMRKLSVFAIFDGMGGTVDGRRASYLATLELDKYMESFSEESVFHAEEVILKMNRRICKEMDEKHVSMGSTATILFLKEGRASISNVGDSRAYLFRGRKLQQISVDHTEENRRRLLKEKLNMTDIKIDEKHKHILTQHLGIKETDFVLEPSNEEYSLEERDILMICSDGLTDVVSKERMELILHVCVTLEEKARTLVTEALQKGGKDNITVILLKV
jgi:protein phosphatase